MQHAILTGGRLQLMVEWIRKETGGPAAVRTSALTGEGIDDLRSAILQAAGSNAGAQHEAGFLTNALEYYDAVNAQEHVIWWKVPVRALGLLITWMFRTYADLRPTTKLVDGRLLAWSTVAWGAAVLGCWSAVLYSIATLIFRRRELATYSGQ